MKLQCGHKTVKCCLQLHLPSWQSSSSIGHCHLLSLQQKLLSSCRHLSLNFCQDSTLVIYLTGCFLYFRESIFTASGRNLKMYFLTGALYWMGLVESITMSGVLLGALFSALIFPSCPCYFPSFPYSTIQYTILKLLTNKWDRLE